MSADMCVWAGWCAYGGDSGGLHRSSAHSGQRPHQQRRDCQHADHPSVGPGMAHRVCVCGCVWVCLCCVCVCVWWCVCVFKYFYALCSSVWGSEGLCVSVCDVCVWVRERES